MDNGEANAATNGSRVTTTVTAGETYYIIVDGYDGRWGRFSLTVTPPAACSAASCDDRNPCTTDTCTAGRCTNTPLADGSACTDGDFCNGLETCNAGRCTAGTAADCNDDNPCTTDSCNPGVGQCTHTSTAGCCASNADCVDSDACTINERCPAGTCVTDARHCGEPGSCEESVCDPATGCAMRPLPEGTACDDADPCTADEQCSAGVCGVAATAALAAKPGLDLETTDFALRRINGRTWRLSARGWFAGSAGIDPTATGLRFQILDADGTSLWDADLPAEAFSWRGDRFVSNAYDTQAKESLRKVELRAVDGGMEVTVVARVPARIAGGMGVGQLRRHLAASTAGRPLTWMVSVGDRCVRDRAITCPLARSGSTRCS